MWRLGEDYTEESLNARILCRMVGGGNGIEHFSNTEIERAYISVIGEVCTLAEQGKKVKRRANPNAPYGVNNDLDIYRLSAQLTVINRDRIASIDELKYRIDKQTADYIAMREQLSQKLLEQEKVQQVIDYCEKYFILSGRNDLSDDDKLLLETYKSCAELNNISSPDDIISLRERNSKLLSEINSLKKTLAEKKNRLAMYSDIRDTYNEIYQGDYISKLIEEEKLRREQKRQMEITKKNKKKGSR